MGSNETDKLSAGSPDRFGFEWSIYSSVLDESKAQLERWLGSTGLQSLRGKSVLDVGCGMGRNPYWMAKAGATMVTAVDVDESSLAAARKNLAPLSNVTVKKCSIYELDPETLGAFDAITCIGVLHHLENPQEALQRMWACVNPGGNLILWCYGRSGNELLLPLIQGLRFVGSRLPLGLTHKLAQGITLGAWPVIHFFPWRTAYYRKLKTLSFRNVESIIFDQIIPKISNYWSREDMAGLVAPLGGVAHIELVQGNSWHARITKPGR